MLDEHVQGLKTSGMLNETKLKVIGCDNALHLMPTLKPM
jgi:hypothetical protein